MITIQYHHTEKDSYVPEALTDLLQDPKYKGKATLVESMTDEIDYYIFGSDTIIKGGAYGTDLNIGCEVQGIGIERKEINDLVGSIQEGKIPTQLKRIIDRGLTPILLVEGVLPDMEHTDMQLQSIYGFMASMSESGIVVEHTTDYIHTAKRILGIAGKVATGGFNTLRVPVIKTKANHHILRRLMALEGVGEEMAEKIRKHYSCDWAFLMDCYREMKTGHSHLMEIEGIGQKMADKIAEQATERWNR